MERKPSEEIRLHKKSQAWGYEKHCGNFDAVLTVQTQYSRGAVKEEVFAVSGWYQPSQSCVVGAVARTNQACRNPLGPSHETRGSLPSSRGGPVGSLERAKV